MSKINIFSCYFCAVMLTVLCIAGAMLASVILVVHNQNEFMRVAGSYSAVRLQQSHIQRKIEELSQEYRFDPASIGQTVNAAALSDFSQKTIAVWLGWISGATAGTAPAWDTAALSNAIQADAGFVNHWPAEEQGAKANEAAQKIGSAIQAAVLPVNVTLGYLGIQAMMPGKTLEMLPQAALIILLAIGLLVAAIRVLQRQRPFQAFWFYGGAALIAFLGISVVLLQLEAFPLSVTLQKYSDVLALYGSSILTLYGNTLRIFSLGLFLAGVLMLVIFFSCRHQRIHSTHHELSTFF